MNNSLSPLDIDPKLTLLLSISWFHFPGLLPNDSRFCQSSSRSSCFSKRQGHPQDQGMGAVLARGAPGDSVGSMLGSRNMWEAEEGKLKLMSIDGEHTAYFNIQGGHFQRILMDVVIQVANHLLFFLWWLTFDLPRSTSWHRWILSRKYPYWTFYQKHLYLCKLQTS